jgi:hypothetical protein
MSQTTSNTQTPIPLPPSANPSAEYARAHTPARPRLVTGDSGRREETPRNADAEPIPTGDRTRPVKALVTVVGFILLVLYGTIAFTSGDLLWFLKRFDSKPARIVVYHDDGKRTNLAPGDPGFEPLAQAIQRSISEGLDRPSGIGLSDASLLDAYTRYVTVEAFFEQPVRLHAWFNTEEPTQMLFPITGRHSDLSLVVLGKNGQYLSSPPVLKTIEPLRETLRELGYH